MKIENISKASSIVEEINKKVKAVENLEEEKALGLRIELKFSGGKIGVVGINKTVPEYNKIVDVITEPLHRDLERLHKEYAELDKE